jgi:hypothetical protein
MISDFLVEIFVHNFRYVYNLMHEMYSTPDRGSDEIFFYLCYLSPYTDLIIFYSV